MQSCMLGPLLINPKITSAQKSLIVHQLLVNCDLYVFGATNSITQAPGMLLYRK